MTPSDAGLFDLIRPSFDRYADRPAVEVADVVWTYRDLASEAGRLAAVFRTADGQDLIGLLASRSRTVYTGLVAILASGRGFVPLSPNWPAHRILDVLSQAGVRTVVVGREGMERLAEIAPRVAAKLRLVLPETTVEAGRRSALLNHAVVDADALPREGRLPASSSADAEGVAYVMFTSGSSGVPKGVPIRHTNACAYIRSISLCARVSPVDRCSHFFDITFDGSIHDVFLAWFSGACLCVLPDHAKLAPAEFIRDRRITCWSSVPSVVALAKRMGKLTPNAFPSLRLTRFGGEALPADAASDWSVAAPNSWIENFYGPTEATVAVTLHRWQEDDPVRNGLVPIGRPLHGVSVLLRNGSRGVVEGAGCGELLVAGEQIACGYLDDDARTHAQFVRLPGHPDRTWYCTGDLVKRDETGLLHYLGRLDDQVQVQGHRVELAEVDAALREVTSCSPALAVPWPSSSAAAEALYAFVPAECDMAVSVLRRELARRLPAYMVPSKVFRVKSFPVNQQGKFDRAALASSLSPP